MLGQRHRRWSNIKTALSEYLVGVVSRPYSIIMLCMRFISNAALRASSQIIASPYILDRHLWVTNSTKALSPGSLLCLGLQTNWLYYCGDLETADQACIDRKAFPQTLYTPPMLGQRHRRWSNIKTALSEYLVGVVSIVFLNFVLRICQSQKWGRNLISDMHVPK